MPGPQFYQAVQFPYSGHRLLDLVDSTYTGGFTRSLLEGMPIADAPPVELAIVKPGLPMDFGFSVMGVPVVSDRAGRLLRDVAPNDVQLLKSNLPGHDTYWTVNLLRMLDCLDEKLTKQVELTGPSDRFVIAGDYVIDPARTSGSQIFRLRQAFYTIVVGEQLKDAILKEKLVGPGLMLLDGSNDQIMPGFVGNRRGSRRSRSNRGGPESRDMKDL